MEFCTSSTYRDYFTPYASSSPVPQDNSRTDFNLFLWHVPGSAFNMNLEMASHRQASGCKSMDSPAHECCSDLSRSNASRVQASETILADLEATEGYNISQYRCLRSGDVDLSRDVDVCVAIRFL